MADDRRADERITAGEEPAPGKQRRRLNDAAYERRRQLVAELDALNAMLREKYGELSDSTPLIRQERDRYG
jgi:hypothetical protein